MLCWHGEEASKSGAHRSSEKDVGSSVGQVRMILLNLDPGRELMHSRLMASLHSFLLGKMWQPVGVGSC
jgi:hypothetical protein